MGSVFLSFALECSHLPKNSILSAKRQFSARFSNCSNSLNFEAKINCNTTKQNDLQWRKTCTGSKFDLVHFNGPHTKFIVDSLYKHPVYLEAVKNKTSCCGTFTMHQYNQILWTFSKIFLRWLSDPHKSLSNF